MRGFTVVAASAFLLSLAPLAFGQAPTAPSGAARDLPSPVINAFEKAYPGAVIVGASQDRQDGKIAFRVEATDKGRRRVLVYDLAGALLEAAEQADEKDLPAPVAAAVHERPHVTYLRGMKITRGVNVFYELTVRGSRKTTMIVKPDGTIVTTR
jgi:hypothetical protein